LFHGTKDKSETGLRQTAEFSPALNDSDLGRTNGETEGNAHFVVVAVAVAVAVVA